MSLDVSMLSIDPKSFKKGQKAAQVSFAGIVANAGDNPVSLELMLEPSMPVFFVDGNGNQVKSIKFKQNFAVTHGIFQKAVTIVVKSTPAQPTGCSLRLEAKDSKGSKSATNSFLIFS